MDKIFEYKDASISYRILGSGKTVVLLHGFGEDSHIFDKQIEFLQDTCQLIVPDLPGSGKSDLLHDAVSIDDYAACVHELLVHENISTCIMLGHSMGGYITLAFAEKHPDLLKAFGFIHSTAFADNEEKKENRKKGNEMVREYGAYSFLKNTISNLFSETYKKSKPEMVAALIENSRKFSKEALIQYSTAMMDRPDRTHVLKNTEVPVLFILGTEDVAAPLKDLLQQVYLPKVSHIHILEGVAHMGMWEATEAVNKHLLDFILAV